MRFKFNRKIIVILYLVTTIVFTWLLQFMPLIIGMDVTDTSISSFDYASIFFTVGGVMPTLVAIIFVLVFYKKEGIIAFLKRCFVPNIYCLLSIGISFTLVCLETLVTQLISKAFGAENLGFEGLKMIGQNPLYIFYFLFWGLISGPLSEEFGWRGFLTDQLFNKKKLLLMSLFIGFLWGVWHLPLYFYPAQIQNEWFHINPFLGIAFVISTMSAAMVYTSIYVISRCKVFPIFFLHMFKNIILTGIMIYPFSFTYKIIVVPVEIIMDLIFYFVITNLPFYKKALEGFTVDSYLKIENNAVSSTTKETKEPENNQEL